jgi:toxin ParE1/3/4
VSDPAEYRLRPRALSDVDELWDFTVETWSEAQAVRYVTALHDDLQMLAEQPGLGRTRDDLSEGLRGFVYSRHVIFYRSTEWGIDVVRILHVNRDIVPDEF